MYLNLEYIFYKTYAFFVGTYHFFTDNKSGFLDALFWVKIISAVLSLGFILGIIHNVMKLWKARRKQITELAKVVIETPPEERVQKWDKIKKYLESGNSSDWKMAVIEADSLLDEIIKKIGYGGETLGERLSKIKPAQFKGLQDAWEAHKVRNKIVHEGERYEISKSKAEKTIELYEKTFKELEYI